jgi:hypothetical protein
MGKPGIVQPASNSATALISTQVAMQRTRPSTDYPVVESQSLSYLMMTKTSNPPEVHFRLLPESPCPTMTPHHPGDLIGTGEFRACGGTRIESVEHCGMTAHQH